MKEIFGKWRQELGSEDLAKALAAAGIYSAAVGLGGTGFDIDQEVTKVVAESADQPVRCVYSPRLGTILSPKELADAWERVKRNVRPPRIEIIVEGEGRRTPGSEDPAWFAELLREPAVGAASSFLSLNPLSQKVEWEWPLRIGFLPDPGSLQMASLCRKTISNLNWLQPLVEVVNTSTHLQALEVLVLPGNLSDALVALENSPHPVYAYVVAVLGGRGRMDWRLRQGAAGRVLKQCSQFGPDESPPEFQHPSFTERLLATTCAIFILSAAYTRRLSQPSFTLRPQGPE